MSLEGQCDDPEIGPNEDLSVCTFPMPAGTVFDWHTHDEHQLAWASSGVLTVRSGSEAWVLPPTRALWIPAGVRHETLSDGVATMRTAYLRPESFPDSWRTCTPVEVSPLVEHLLHYLAGKGMDVLHRRHAEQLLVDLLVPVSTVSFQVRMPSDDRALEVAQKLKEDPADGRTLAEWGFEVGSSSRTLARAFLSDTGMTFARWRTLVRLNHALEALGANEQVAEVARKVGYESASAFVASFRRETGITPAKYFRTSTIGSNE